MLCSCEYPLFLTHCQLFHLICVVRVPLLILQTHPPYSFPHFTTIHHPHAHSPNHAWKPHHSVFFYTHTSYPSPCIIHPTLNLTPFIPIIIYYSISTSPIHTTSIYIHSISPHFLSLHLRTNLESSLFFLALPFFCFLSTHAFGLFSPSMSCDSSHHFGGNGVHGLAFSGEIRLLSAIAGDVPGEEAR